MGREVGDVAALEAHRARVRHELAGELPDQGGLPRAVRPDDRVDLVRADRERHVVGGGDPAEGLVQSCAGDRAHVGSSHTVLAAREDPQQQVRPDHEREDDCSPRAEGKLVAGNQFP